MEIIGFNVIIRGNQCGGFSVEIEELPEADVYAPFPIQIVHITFYPDEIRGKYWQIPNTPEAWRGEFIAVWDELMEWLRKGER